MNKSGSVSTAIGLVLTAVALVGVYFIYRMTQYAPNEILQVEYTATPTPSITPLPTATATPLPTIEPTPNTESSTTPAATPLPTAVPNPSPTTGEFTSTDPNAEMIIPVVGVKAKDLTDTYTAARSEGRVHNALDIMAKGGTPVVAAADGEIARFFDSQRGGITIYQISPDKSLVYYYAHLQRRADGLQEKQSVKKGTLLGYVGDTGNSGTGNFHLHFAIWRVQDPKHIWDGENINPYSLLKNAPEAAAK